MKIDNHFDVIIIGAGAAGLICAMESGKRGKSVLLIDHSKKIGEKIRISGGGKCNFTNLNTHHSKFISNNDKPGFIGSLGTLLGDKKVNIASFYLGRTGSGEAVSLLELDQFLADDIVSSLVSLTNVKKVKVLKF